MILELVAGAVTLTVRNPENILDSPLLVPLFFWLWLVLAVIVMALVADADALGGNDGFD